MESSSLKSHEVVARLARRSRVIILGGIAVVLHGFHRSTKDIDVWLDPLEKESAWADSLRLFIESEDLTAARASDALGHFIPIHLDEIASAVAQDRFVRILGAERPIDAFRVPNQLEANEFDEVWERSRRLEDGTRLPDEIDLIVTKMETGRAHDEADMRFLQSKVERLYRAQIKTCSLNAASKLFQRFVTPDIAAFAAAEAEKPEVRTLALHILTDLCESGDPYAIQLKEDIERKDPKHGASGA